MFVVFYDYFWPFCKIFIGYLIIKPIVFAVLPLVTSAVYINPNSVCSDGRGIDGIPPRYGSQRESPIVDVSRIERNADVKKALQKVPAMAKPPEIKRTETPVIMTGHNGCKWANTLDYIIDRSSSISGKRIENIKKIINAN